MKKEIILKKEFDNYSREELINEIKQLEQQLEIGRVQFIELEERIIGANTEIKFLRQVIINLTKNNRRIV